MCDERSVDFEKRVGSKETDLKTCVYIFYEHRLSMLFPSQTISFTNPRQDSPESQKDKTEGEIPSASQTIQQLQIICKH